MKTLQASPTSAENPPLTHCSRDKRCDSGLSTIQLIELSRAQLVETFQLKHGNLSQTGWAPRMQRAFDYFNPDDCYEALVACLIKRETRWLDVGCGRTLFPSNPRLARVLAHRCRELVGVDPSGTLGENPYVHQCIRVPIEEFHPTNPFDVVTLRMVAEHIEQPQRALESLAKATRPGSLVVVYTVNKWSPVSVVSRLVPFALHHRLKNLTWKVMEKDTYPVVYRMNTRNDLRDIFQAAGFRERYFAYLDDCRASGRFRRLRYVELSLCRLLRRMGMRYPETCLLAVFERLPPRRTPVHSSMREERNLALHL